MNCQVPIYCGEGAPPSFHYQKLTSLDAMNSQEVSLQHVFYGLFFVVYSSETGEALRDFVDDRMTD